MAPLDTPPPRFGDLPASRGLLFECLACGRPYAVPRDTALRAWGERGIIADVCRRLRCANCRRRGMRATLAPWRARLGSKSELVRLLDAMAAVKPRGQIS